MPKNEQKLISTVDFFHALALLTRIPTPWTNLHHSTEAGRTFAASAWSWPIIGAALGLLAGLIGVIATGFGVHAGISAGLVLAAYMMLTGALHEDGLADTFDGLWGGHDTARRLEIMKDSHIGTYGVLALCLSVILRWTALTTLIHSGWILAPLMAAALLSRVPMAVLMAKLPNARDEGLAHITGRPSRATLFAMIGIALALGLCLIGWQVFQIAFWIALVSIALGVVAKNKIGGQTGDILGASQQLAEVTALAALVAMVT